MINMNETLREFGLGWSNSFLFNLYSATTIRDFLENREFIKLTRKILPPAIFLCGSALISLENPVTYKKLNENKGQFYDLNDSFSFALEDYFYKYKKIKSIEDRKRLYDVTIIYTPKTEMIYLFDYKTEGPPQSERKYEKAPAEKLGLAFRF